LTLPLPKKEDALSRMPEIHSIVMEQSNEDDASFESQNYNLKQSNIEDDLGAGDRLDKTYLFQNCLRP